MVVKIHPYYGDLKLDAHLHIVLHPLQAGLIREKEKEKDCIG